MTGGNASASETDISPADRDSAGPTKHRTIAIRTLFRNTVKAITRRDDDEPPLPSRRRRGETDKGFGVAAKATLRRAIWLPQQAYFAATDLLIGTLDCMNPWPDDTNNFDDLDVDNNNADKNYTSLHL